MQYLAELQQQLWQRYQIQLEDCPIEIQETEQALVLTTDFPSNNFNQFSPTGLQWQTKIQAHPTQLLGYKLNNISNAIAIASGKGGVGKSTISCNLACSLQQLGAQVGLLDADIYGPSIPQMMGIQTQPECIENNKYRPVTSHGVACMSMGILHKNGPLIWRGPMLAKALIEMLNQTSWPRLDYLFIDMPPGTGDISLSLCQKIPLSGAIIVTTPQSIATQDAEKALQMFLRLQIPILGIIANMSHYECEHCHQHSAIFGDQGAKILAERYQVPILGEVPLTIATRIQADQGQPIASQPDTELYTIWQKIALKVAIELGLKHKTS